MAFLLLITGQVVEVAQTRAQVKSAMSTAGVASADATVKTQPMTFFGAGNVVAAAENQSQVDFAIVG